jgi:DNA-binding NtrC family response regulator
MPLDVQAKLLLAIEQRVVRRVGAVQPTRIDVRFICATHRDLAEEVKRDRFRSDFYYRINGLTIRIPPLRERLDEIDGLVAQFVRDAGERIGPQHLPAFEPEALACLREHSWPGNIRELRNLVERALVLSDGEDITVAKLRAAGLPGTEMPGKPDCERARLLAVLADCGGNQSRAARRLGISRNTLIARIQQFGIARPRGLVE